MGEAKDLDLGSKEPEEILHEMEVTRHALAEKLETLETEVKGTVSEAKANMSEKVQHIREIFDLNKQIEKHPWVFFGGSVVVGMALGQLLSPRTSSYVFRSADAARTRSLGSRFDEDATYTSPPTGSAVTGSGTSGSTRSAITSKASSFVTGIERQFGPELRQLKEVAVGTLASTMRDMVKDVLPAAVSDRVGQIVENAARKLGGEPVHDDPHGPDQPVTGGPTASNGFVSGF